LMVDAVSLLIFAVMQLLLGISVRFLVHSLRAR
jgi:hypothetical protein